MGFKNDYNTGEDLGSILDRVTNTPPPTPEQQLEKLTVPGIGRELPERLPPQRSMMRKIGDKALAFAQTAADEAAMGLTRPINTLLFGTAYAAANLNRGENPLEGYSRAYNEIDSTLDNARDNLGVAGETGASLLGALMPGSVAGKVDDMLDPAFDLARLVAPKPGDAWIRAYRSGVAAGTGNMMQSYFEGNTSVEDLAVNGGLGMLFGGTMQKLIGDNAIPMFERMSNRVKGDPNVAAALKEMASSGPNQRGLSFENLARVADWPEVPGGMLDTKIGDAPLYENWARLNDGIARIAFRDVDPTKINEPDTMAYLKEYEDMVGLVRTYQNNVNADALDEVRLAVGAPESRATFLERSNNDLKAARQLFGTLSSTVNEGDVGRTIINAPKLLDGLEPHLASAFGRRQMLEAPPSVRRMYGKFNDLIRGLDQESTARDFRNIPSKGKDAPRADEIFNDIPLARLMDARAEFSSMLTPSMAFQSGMSPADLKAGVEILKYVDNQIDEVVGGQYGLARGAFSAAKRQEELYDLGSQFYRQRLDEVTDQEAFSKFYGEHMDAFLDELSPQEFESFSAGFRNSLFNKTGDRSFYTEMRNFIGDYNPNTPAGNVRTKTGNLAQLRRILGEEDTNRLLRVYNEGDALRENTDRLTQTLIDKGVSPNQVSELSTLARDTISIDQNRPEFLQNTIKPIARWMFKPSDQRIADGYIKLLTERGPRLQTTLAEGLENAVGGFPRQVGMRMGMGLTGGGVDVDEEKEFISQFLRQVGNHGRDADNPLMNRDPSREPPLYDGGVILNP